MRAMRVEGADPALLVAEHDNLLAQQLSLRGRWRSSSEVQTGCQ